MLESVKLGEVVVSFCHCNQWKHGRM